jgi:hypothetical protein
MNYGSGSVVKWAGSFTPCSSAMPVLRHCTRCPNASIASDVDSNGHTKIASVCRYHCGLFCTLLRSRQILGGVAPEESIEEVVVDETPEAVAEVVEQEPEVVEAPVIVIKCQAPRSLPLLCVCAWSQLAKAPHPRTGRCLVCWR